MLDGKIFFPVTTASRKKGNSNNSREQNKYEKCNKSSFPSTRRTELTLLRIPIDCFETVIVEGIFKANVRIL
jgi:hypothetical protein